MKLQFTKLPSVTRESRWFYRATLPDGRSVTVRQSFLTDLWEYQLDDYGQDSDVHGGYDTPKAAMRAADAALFPKPTLADIYAKDPVKACRLALRRTAKLPEHDRLEAIDKLLGTHGTEAIRGDWQNGYWCDIVAAYCNTGDTYAVTVLQVRGEYSFDHSRFIVGTMGDFVERNEKRFGII